MPPRPKLTIKKIERPPDLGGWEICVPLEDQDGTNVSHGYRKNSSCPSNQSVSFFIDIIWYVWYSIVHWYSTFIYKMWHRYYTFLNIFRRFLHSLNQFTSITFIANQQIKVNGRICSSLNQQLRCEPVFCWHICYKQCVPNVLSTFFGSIFIYIFNVLSSPLGLFPHSGEFS